jgi:hypothetical protein
MSELLAAVLDANAFFYRALSMADAAMKSMWILSCRIHFEQLHLASNGGCQLAQARSPIGRDSCLLLPKLLIPRRDRRNSA